jgi:cytosine deaminase
MAESGPQSRVGKMAVEAGVSVVTLPQTNLYLQAREQETAQPRGLTAVGPLLREGVNVAGGGDNLRDPFCPVGRADPLETAALLVMAAHLSPAEAYAAVSDNARRAIGLPPVAIEPGAPAELVAIPATSITEAVAAAPNRRTVIHHGRIVSG